MPLGKFHRRYGKTSSDGSLKDVLYDRLLESLADGGEPLATEKDYWHWLRSWSRLHPGESIGLLDERMPWPIRRRQALTLLGVFDQETFLGLQEVVLEVSEADSCLDSVAEEERIKAKWAEWRNGVVEKYRLQEWSASRQEPDRF